jgi:hypothetical protein
MKKLYAILVIAIAFASCSQQKFVVMPAFTDVPHIERLKPGMSKSEVSNTLEISPIDFFYLQDGSDVFVYNYRLTEKRIPVTNNTTRANQDGVVQNDHIDGAAARTAGTMHYTEWRKLYVSFKSDKLDAMITDAGKNDANAVLIQLASLETIQSNPKLKVVPHSITDYNYFVPLDEKGNYIYNSGNQNGANSSQIIQDNPTNVATIPNEDSGTSQPSKENKNQRRGKKKK